jgi:prepilin-type processing-associated H-X9-DG protein
LSVSTAHAGEKGTPTDLGLVPADATGFVHVRVADVWKSDALKLYRDIVMKAGDALDVFDRRFAPAPSSIDRFTAYFLAPKDGKREPDIVMILTTTKPILRDAFLKQTLPDAEAEKAGEKTIHVSKQKEGAACFYDERTLLFGPTESIRNAVAKAPARTGPLATAIKAAADGKAMVLAGNLSALPPQALAQIPPPFHPILKAEPAMIQLDIEKPDTIHVSLRYASAEDAESADRAARLGMDIARRALAQPKEQMLRKIHGEDAPTSLEQLPEAAGALFALGAINTADAMLTNPPLKRDGDTLRLELKLPAGVGNSTALAPLAVALFVPAVQKVRSAATKSQDMNNLRQMAIAMHNYHDTYKGLPSAAICDKAGKPLLSWRVAILPYIEQDHLYRQFKLDEPWDSPHNKKLIALMPPVYLVPSNPPSRPGETHYRVFYGGGALFDLDKKVPFFQVTDGTSNTVMIVETADSVPWTKPDDIRYDPKAGLPRFGDFFGSRTFNVAFADGSVRTLRMTLPEVTMHALITRSGGEVVNPDD